MYKTTQASVTVDPSSAPNFKSIGFIFCVVASQLPSDNNNFIGCDCNLETDNGENFIGCDCNLETDNGERVTLGNTNAWTSIHSLEFFSTIFLYRMMKCVVCKTVNAKRKTWKSSWPVIIQRLHLNYLLKVEVLGKRGRVI